MSLRPAIAFIDLGIAGLDGLSLISRLRSVRIKTKLVVVSSHLDDYTLIRLSSLSVDGFVDKTSTSLRALIVAIATIAKGGTYFSPEFLAARTRRHLDPQAIHKHLTPTECDVLVAIGNGASDQEIGHWFGIAAATAQKHRANLFKKLGISGSAKLVAFAVRHGFMGPITSQLAKSPPSGRPQLRFPSP
jgi:two-component system, NarL family, response regulator EvgA